MLQQKILRKYQEEVEEKPVEEKIEPPVEISSVNKSIQIIKDGNEYTIRFAPLVAEEIGAYRRCNVCVKFTEGGRVQVLQDVDKL